MRGYFNTIEDMERLYYSEKGAKFIQKGTDYPVITTSGGYYNPVYGAETWRQLNQLDNAFGLLPKVPFNRTGWRALTARADAITTAVGGVAEAGDLPDLVQPTITTVSAKPKQMARTFGNSIIQEYLSKLANDDYVGDMEYLKAYFGIEHKEHIDKALLTDVDTTANLNFESIDRVCSNYSEVSSTTIGLHTNDADIYGLNRDAATTWADAYVNHNNGSDRSLSDAIMRTSLMNVHTNGGKPSYLLTGFDLYADIQGLYADQARYLNPRLASGLYRATVNGVETVEGSEIGMDIATLYGIPIFQDNKVVKDVKSRLYILDTHNPEGFEHGRLVFAVAQPTSYYESRDPFALDALINEGMYLTMGELRCTFFGAQGKIRDLL